ncbi:hypothetical protein O6H91_03G080500 [Diphasiastrum complanatum]|nr:hypothetical protein O6H91_03G080500 [Diphasiastrum complanatum]
MIMAPPLASLISSESGRVLSIQSHTVQGYVGNKSAVFPLQLLGFDVDPINSVQFSNHTGYPTWKGQVLDGEQLWSLIEGLEANNLLFYTHLLTVCDPVMGDEGKLYIKPELVPLYKDKVVPLASMLTPNQFEAELLTGCSIHSEADALEACKKLHGAGPSKVVITSLDINSDLLLIGSHLENEEDAPKQFLISMPKIPAYFTGTGDLMAALLLGWSYKYPNSLETAAELAVASLQAVLERTLLDYNAAKVQPEVKQLELRLIQSQEQIKHPIVEFHAKRFY